MAVKKLRVGLIGLGARGSSLLESVLLPMEDVEITAVCDVYEDRTASATAPSGKGWKTCPVCFAKRRPAAADACSGRRGHL